MSAVLDFLRVLPSYAAGHLWLTIPVAVVAAAAVAAVVVATRRTRY